MGELVNRFCLSSALVTAKEVKLSNETRYDP